jgi:hypothetical protein
MIEWEKLTKEDMETIGKIVDRVSALATEYGEKIDRISFNMDISAAYLHTPLDLQQLLDFPDFDFAHDVFGIRQHLDRSTGELKDCFIPCCSL